MEPASAPPAEPPETRGEEAYLPQGDLFDFQPPGQEQQRANQDLLLERKGILCVFLAQSHPVPVHFRDDLGYVSEADTLGDQRLAGGFTCKVSKPASFLRSLPQKPVLYRLPLPPES